MRSVVLMLSAALLFPAAALADGVAFTVVGGSTEVRATEQRAVLWLRNGNWEIHIQPVFPREAGGAAWVVPFTVQPTVQPGNADFFDQLELITSPVFVKVCAESTDSFFCFGCMGADRGGLGNDGEVKGVARVIIWDQGQVGDLDYVILSTFTGDNLVDWLNTEGYQLPVGASEVIADYQTEGVYFFVARLSADADPQKPLAPVRFILPGLSPPTYPLRLTSLGVPPGQELGLTLWVVFPEWEGYQPDSHPVKTLAYGIETIEEFDQGLDDLFAGNPPDTLALLYTDIIRYSDVLNGEVCTWYGCVPFADLGIEVPDWTEEIREIRSDQHRLYRYQARLSASSLARDLTLRWTDPAHLEWVSNIYEEHTCKENVAAMTWLLVMGVGLGLLRRIRRA